jgi:hypothetical protein
VSFAEIRHDSKMSGEGGIAVRPLASVCRRCPTCNMEGDFCRIWKPDVVPRGLFRGVFKGSSTAVFFRGELT